MKNKNNIKALQETRAEKLERLEVLYASLEAEQRAVTEDEENEINDLSKEIENIDKTINILNSMKEKLASNPEDDNAEGGEGDGAGESRAEAEEKIFEEYLRGEVTGESRADVNMTKGENGDIIPTTIANKIIKKVYDISPILDRATKYSVKGKLEIPFYSETTNDITMTYKDEFVELESNVGKFKTIELTGFLAGVLTLVSRSLINNAAFDIVSFVVDHMAYNVSRWVEKELISGTEGKIKGLSGVTKKIEASTANSIKTDELIELQDSIKDVFQDAAIWVMAPTTRTHLRKLKDGNGRYLLQDDITSPFGKTLLGKPCAISDNMPDMAAGQPAIYYGDMSGLAVKIAEELEIQVLREKYATQHAVGVVGWLEMDAKIEDEQKISKLVMKAA